MALRSHHGISLSPPLSEARLVNRGHTIRVTGKPPSFALPRQSLPPELFALTRSTPPTGTAPESSTDSLSVARALVESRGGPGVLVLSASLKLLYMNDEAREMTSAMNRTPDGRKANVVLPSGIMSFCEELLRLMNVRTGPKDWEQAQLRRVSGHGLGFVLLRGLGFPAVAGVQEAHLIVMMEEINGRREITAERAKERFHLTDREQTVIIYLLKGLTNKEIASRLMITEQTVKEHLKHIMHKTNVTTRTGVLAQILLAPSWTLHPARMDTAQGEVLEQI